MNLSKLPTDVRAYALSQMGWSEATFAKVEAEFYLYKTMNWSQATWEEIRDALTEVLNEVMESTSQMAANGCGDK